MVWDKNERIHQSQSYLGAKHLSLENTYILLKKTFKDEKQKNAKGRNSVRIINRNTVIFKIEIAEHLSIHFQVVLTKISCFYNVKRIVLSH